MSKYVQELKTKENMLERSIFKTENKLEKMSVKDPDFMKVYEALNLLRIDLKTVQSRIEHYGEDRKGFEEKYIPGL